MAVDIAAAIQRGDIPLPVKHTIIDAPGIDRMLTRMAHEILEVHKGAEKLTLIGIQTRGVHMVRRLRKRIQAIEGIEVPVGILDITLYRDDWTRISHHPVIQATDISFSLDDRDIILMDDVLFTGRTVRAAMDALIDFGRPQRIELAVLVDRGHREIPIQDNYIGKVVPTRKTETVNVMLSESDDVDQIVVEERSEADGN